MSATAYLHVETVAARLGVIYREIKRGKLPATKIGRLTRISETQLAEYLEKQQTGSVNA